MNQSMNQSMNNTVVLDHQVHVFHRMEDGNHGFSSTRHVTSHGMENETTTTTATITFVPRWSHVIHARRSASVAPPPPPAGRHESGRLGHAAVHGQSRQVVAPSPCGRRHADRDTGQSGTILFGNGGGGSSSILLGIFQRGSVYHFLDDGYLHEGYI